MLPELHERLTHLGEQRGVSLGLLVREACVRQYEIVPSEDRLEVVRSLEALSLPVGEPIRMKKESVSQSG